MATSISTSLNDKLIAQTALESFVADMEGLALFTTSYSSEVVRRGSTVEVPLVANLTATTFADDYTADGGTLSNVSVSVNNHKIVSVSISDTEYSKSSVAEVTKFSMQAGKALAQAVLESVYGLFVTTAGSAAQFSATLTNLSAFSITNARSLRKALSDAKVPQTERNLILNTSLYDSLLSQSGLLDASAFGGRDAIVDGRVPRVLGMNVYESLVLPTNSISLSGIAVHPNAVAIAVRALEPQAPSEYLAAATVTDPQTGLTIGVRRFYRPETGKHHMAFEAVWGASRAITAAAKLALGA
jgi:hypothetical protein